MAISKKQLLRTRLKAIRSTLHGASAKEKEGLAGISLTENFNTILTEIAEEYPELKDSLPTHISSRGPFQRIGKSSVSYLDLEALADQAIALLDLVEEQ
jgi:hypothetical protein